MCSHGRKELERLSFIAGIPQDLLSLRRRKTGCRGKVVNKVVRAAYIVFDFFLSLFFAFQKSSPSEEPPLMRH
jgi:hypothetical protein